MLPEVAQADRQSARVFFTEAVRHLPSEHGIHRTQDAYLRFLRAGWSVASGSQRREAVHAGVSAAQRSANETTSGAHWYFEYYLPQRTVHFESEEEARLYDLLPFVDQVDQKLGKSLRAQHPSLREAPVPAIGARPWRSGVLASPGRDTPEIVRRAFELHHLMFLGAWAQEDAGRAASVALSAKDASLRRAALAIVLPFYAKTNAPQAEAWRLDLAGSTGVEGKDQLAFLVALVRADFALGHPDDAEKLAWQAWKLGVTHLAGNSDDDSFEDVQNLVDVCGEFWFGDPGWYAELNLIEKPVARQKLLARYARGALRNRPHYEEPT